MATRQARPLFYIVQRVLVLQALPTSLQELEATWVPVEVLAPLTALRYLNVRGTVSTAPSSACSLSTLQQLATLGLGAATDAALQAFGGCTGLRCLSFSSASRIAKLQA